MFFVLSYMQIIVRVKNIHIPLIKRSVQTSVLQCATNTHKRTEPTCVGEINVHFQVSNDSTFDNKL